MKQISPGWKPLARSTRAMAASRETDGGSQSQGSLGRSLLSLQQVLGNRAVGRFLSSGPIQTKLWIGPPGDRFEREADRTADAVMRRPADSGASPATLSRTSGFVGAQRMCAECAEEEEEKVRRQASPPDPLSDPRPARPTPIPPGEGAPPPSPSRTAVERSRSFPITLGDLRGRGSPLPPSARSFFEPRFGQDFSDVRIHTGTTAAEASLSIHARAFTVGRDVVFGAGEYGPGSSAGRRLLAHELTHVVQQTPQVRRKPFGSEASTAEPMTGEAAPESTTEETRETSPNPSPETEPASEGAVARGLIVNDEATELDPGQMRKSAFLAEVRTAVCGEAEEAFAGTEHTTQGCPWIEAALRFYEGRSAERLERDMAGYVPEAAGVASAREYIPFIAARVRQSTETWVETGEITGLPEGLPGMGLAGALVGSLTSSLAGLFFKARSGGPRGTSHPRAVQARLGAGRPLGSTVRSRMESAFGRSFSSVRIHDGTDAARLSSQFNARAFTVGNHVAFAGGEYRPGSPIGDALVAHELAHVVQQKGATDAQSQAFTADRVLEEDADRSALGAVGTLWGRSAAPKVKADSVFGPPKPQSRTGLRLQRCGGTSSATPLPGQASSGQTGRLIDIAGMRGHMRDMWRRATADVMNPVEWSLTLIRNTSTGGLRAISQQGEPQRLNSPARVLICLPRGQQLGANEILLGTIHTHPLPPSEGPQEASEDDLSVVAGHPERCGTEHYVISREFIYRFDTSGSTPVERTQEFLGL